MKRIALYLLLALPALAQFQPQTAYSKGSVTLSFETNVEFGDRLHLKTTDDEVNAFLVTLKWDYRGYIVTRSVVIDRQPSLGEGFIARSSGMVLPCRIEDLRSVKVEPQKSSGSEEF